MVAIVCLAASLAHAQLPVALQGRAAATSLQWKQARPVLQAAMRCEQRMAHTDAVRAVFHLTNDNYDGEHRLPAALGVDGYPTTVMTVVEGWQGEATSYSVDLDAPMDAVVRASALVALPDQPGRFTRQVRAGGRLIARKVGAGVVRLTCTWPPPEVRR